MARVATPLSDSLIRQAKPASKPIKLADGGGMYLLLRPDGSRYWRLDYRFGGKRKTLALGVYPETSLSEARKQRRAAKALLAEGHDPGAVKKAGKASHKPRSVAEDEQAHALAIIGEGIWDWELSSGLVRHNVQWARMMGLSPRQPAHTWKKALARVHELEREKVMALIQDCLNGKAAFDCEHRIQHADGSVVWVQNRGKVVERSAEGKPLRMVGSLREVTEQKREVLAMQRRNLLLQAIAAVNQMLMAELSEQELMTRVCQELIRNDLFRMAWIGRVDEDSKTVRPVAEAGCVRDYLTQADIRCDDSPQGRGPTGTAIRMGTTVVNNDTEINQRFSLWRDRARAQGYRSSAAAPLRVNGQVVGALNVYSHEAHAFGLEKVMLLEKLAADLGMAIGHRASLAALRESEERFRLLLDSSPEAIFGVDTQGLCTFVNPACLNMLGYTQEEMLGKSIHPLIHHTHPDGRPYPRQDCHVHNSTLHGQPTHVDSEVHWRKDGSSFPVEYWSHPMYRNGELVGAVVNFVDITERRRAEEALRESEARFRAMAEHSADWIWSIDTQGRHTYSNQRGLANLGYDVNEFLVMNAGSMVHPDDLPLFHETFEKAVSAQHGWQNIVLRWRHRNGNYRTFESNASALFSESGQLIGFQGVDRDITERRQAEARIEFLAHHDVLTGLPNRVLLRDRFEHALAIAERSRSRVAMLFLDLDNFKVVNDTLGHVAGDQLLLEVVARLSNCTRESDTISRQGGDEFILLLNDIPDLETVERIANKILTHLADPVDINGHELNAACSIGVALYPDDGNSFDTLLQKADAAMYNAKGAGRNIYRFFDDKINRQAHEHLLLQNRLNQALFQAEFYLNYQPQLEIDSGRIVGVEALLRWRNPELGEVVPARFIPVAEDCGLIVPIGAWVMEEACRQAQALQQAGRAELTMSVNLSALQFRRAGLVETVAGALERSGLPPHLLELELTESILLQDVENTLDTVRRLKALGVRLSIDDFGTGYSSLSYLKRFAVDRLKIDRSFVRDVNTDPDNAAIVRAVIQLARSLRLGIVAEGVETEAQLAFLREEGCQDVQGYLFSRPLALAALKEYLHERMMPVG
ncbi:MAG: EAL domain-containing protein [Thiobacillus sp.]|nr:EAL domain-containing protein [Thiobacillus sp.]